MARTGADPAVAAVDGYVLAFRIGVVLLVVGAVAAVTLLERVRTPQPDVAAVPVDVADVAAA